MAILYTDPKILIQKLQKILKDPLWPSRFSLLFPAFTICTQASAGARGRRSSAREPSSNPRRVQGSVCLAGEPPESGIRSIASSRAPSDESSPSSRSTQSLACVLPCPIHTSTRPQMSGQERHCLQEPLSLHFLPAPYPAPASPGFAPAATRSPKPRAQNIVHHSVRASARALLYRDRLANMASSF